MLDRIMSPVGFGLVAICFLFTFCEVSCGGDPIMRISGVNLALGTDPEPMGILANEELDMGDADDVIGEDSSERNIFALVAFLAALGGLIFYFLLPAGLYSILAFLAGLIGFGALLYLKFDLVKDLDEEAREMVNMDFKPAYWVATGLSLLTAVFNLLRWRNR